MIADQHPQANTKANTMGNHHEQSYTTMNNDNHKHGWSATNQALTITATTITWTAIAIINHWCIPGGGEDWWLLLVLVVCFSGVVTIVCYYWCCYCCFNWFMLLLLFFSVLLLVLLLLVVTSVVGALCFVQLMLRLFVIGFLCWFCLFPCCLFLWNSCLWLKPTANHHVTVSRLLVCWWLISQQLVITDVCCDKNNNNDQCCYDCCCDQQQTAKHHVKNITFDHDNSNNKQ